MKQIELESYNHRGKQYVVWLDDITPKHIGKVISLKDNDELWIVRNVYSYDMASKDVRKTWHVGGL